MKTFIEMKFLLATILISTIIICSCGKRRELRQLGCVKGKSRITEGFHYVGAMTKKEFYAYLDSPSFYYKNELINFDMQWSKIDKPEECPSGR
jgi:hypothetical protein